MLGISPLLVNTLPATIGWALLWGVCVSLPVVPQQKRLVTYAPGASPVLLGLNGSAIYLGIALGSALGGLLQQQLTPARLGLVAAALSALGLLLNQATLRRSAPAPIARPGPAA